jgi:hypothetical protein
MADERPVLDQINLVVRDMEAMIKFYRRLGVEIVPTAPPWDRHHRTASTPDGLDLDLDSTEFAAQWNRGWPAGQAGQSSDFESRRGRQSIGSTTNSRTQATADSNRPMTRSGERGTRSSKTRRGTLSVS